MSRTNLSGIILIVFSVLFWAGCNDAFRPIATPIPQPGPDPQKQNLVMVTSTNTSGMPGAMSSIDVPGDTVASIQYAGLNSVQGAAIGGRAFVLNEGAPSITSLIPANFTIAPVTAPLPNGSTPVFMYAAVPNFLWVAEGPTRDFVGQVQIVNGTLINEIALPAGASPVAITQTPNGGKVYSVNHGNNTVSVIQAANETLVGTIPVGTAPVDAVVSSDGAFVFVANEGSNDITVIDTNNDVTPLTTIALPGSPGCSASPLLPLGTLPCFSLTFDPGLKRLYVASAASNTVSIIRADQPFPTLPSLLTSINVNSDPTCAGSSPRQVAVLPDGSRAYVANTGSDNVCVLNTLNNTFTKSIPVGSAPLSVGTSSDGTKAYTANSGSNNISVIRTDLDQEITDSTGAPFRLKAPKLDANCVDPAPPALPVCTYQSPIHVTR